MDLKAKAGAAEYFARLDEKNKKERMEAFARDLAHSGSVEGYKVKVISSEKLNVFLAGFLVGLITGVMFAWLLDIVVQAIHSQ